MKKLIFAFLIFGIFASCKEKSQVQAELEIPENADSTKANPVSQSVAPDSEKIDCDLSQMNSNMVYAEVFNMMTEPDFYDGKIVRMRGNFAIYDNEMTGKKSYAVIISDALACCQTGIEFQYDFQGNEPKSGEVVTVTGSYEATMIGDVGYNYVIADSVEL